MSWLSIQTYVCATLLRKRRSPKLAPYPSDPQQALCPMRVHDLIQLADYGTAPALRRLLLANLLRVLLAAAGSLLGSHQPAARGGRSFRGSALQLRIRIARAGRVVIQILASLGILERLEAEGWRLRMVRKRVATVIFVQEGRPHNPEWAKWRVLVNRHKCRHAEKLSISAVLVVEQVAQSGAQVDATVFLQMRQGSPPMRCCSRLAVFCMPHGLLIETSRLAQDVAVHFALWRMLLWVVPVDSDADAATM
mmetsp:Transcript_97989/g.179075  ORF Transcript_97989/g.179075 Transcript_97989/m.179075 type:complete len:251 (+) Transcript_97989:31-783(+)